MMRRFCLIVLAFALLFTAAAAETAISPLANDAVGAQGVRMESRTEEQACFLPVTVVYLKADGSEGSRSTMYIPAYTISYEVTVNADDTGRIIGGSVAKDSELRLTPSAPWVYDLDVAITKETDPQTSVIDQVDTYQIYVIGGLYTVTYNSTFYIDVDGSLDHVDRETVNRTYYYDKTYSQP